MNFVTVNFDNSNIYLSHNVLKYIVAVEEYVVFLPLRMDVYLRSAPSHYFTPLFIVVCVYFAETVTVEYESRTSQLSGYVKFIYLPSQQSVVFRR